MNYQKKEKRKKKKIKKEENKKRKTVGPDSQYQELGFHGNIVKFMKRVPGF